MTAALLFAFAGERRTARREKHRQTPGMFCQSALCPSIDIHHTMPPKRAQENFAAGRYVSLSKLQFRPQLALSFSRKALNRSTFIWLQTAASTKKTSATSLSTVS